MMKMIMRPQPAQFNQPTLYKYTAVGVSTFDKRDAALMFGFTTYEAFLVGGAGGRSGNATTNAADLGGGVTTLFGSGGGGGGCLHLRDALSTLSPSEEVSVGYAGGNGSGSGSYNSPAGSGQTGGVSSFHGHSAYGGGGAIGGDWNVSGAAGNQDVSCYGGDGGPGGTNSAGLSGGGDGGTAGYLIFGPSSGGSADAHLSTLPTAGTYSAGGDAPVIGGGAGGGGGPGKNDGIQKMGGFGTDVPRAGASGNGPDYLAAGGAVSGNLGGSGGGADLFPLTGVHEKYGEAVTGGVATGAVVIKIS